MKYIQYIYNKFVWSAISLFLPALIWAQTTGGGANNPPTSNEIKFRLTNPLSIGGTDPNIVDIIKAVLERIIMPIAAVVVVLGILYAGFKFVIAQGNETKLREARSGLMWVLVGAVILLGAAGISEALTGTVKSIFQ